MGLVYVVTQMHVGNHIYQPHVPISPNSPFQVRTMSGKDPEDVKKEIEQEDPEGLEMPPLEKDARL